MPDLSKWSYKINPNEDLLDTREILDRIEDLESEYLDEDGETGPRHTWIPSDRTEWEGLQDLISEVGEDASRDGVTLIRESYFRDYIKDQYEDIGGEYHEFDRNTDQYRHIPLDELYSRAPFKHIDWDAVAEDERHDYSIFEFDGVTYYYEGQ